MHIIDELNAEGINLQETVLNLEHQGYEQIWTDFIKYTLLFAIWSYTINCACESMKENFA